MVKIMAYVAVIAVVLVVIIGPLMMAGIESRKEDNYENHAG